MSDKTLTTIGLVSGSFKPFHRGHYELIRTAAEENDIVELFVSLSTRSRPGELVVKGDAMSQIWKNYIEPFLSPNVVVNYVPIPIRSAYEFMQEKEEQNSQDDVITIYSDSNDMTGNFPLKNLEKYVPNLLGRGQIKIKSFDRENFVQASGTSVRKAILSGDKQSFLSMMPKEIDSESIWEILSSEIEVAPEKPLKRKTKLSEGLFKFDQYLNERAVDILISNFAQSADGVSLRYQFTDQLPVRTRGKYVMVKQTLYVNKKKSSEQLKSQVRTILHEIEHWNQHVLDIISSDSIDQATEKFSQRYRANVKRYGYMNAPEEVEARRFSEENLQDALRLLDDYYSGKNEGMTVDDVVEEIFDMYDVEPTPVTRFMIGSILSDYSLNNKQNLDYVAKNLKDLGVKLA